VLKKKKKKEKEKEKEKEKRKKKKEGFILTPRVLHLAKRRGTGRNVGWFPVIHRFDFSFQWFVGVLMGAQSKPLPTVL